MGNCSSDQNQDIEDVEKSVSSPEKPTKNGKAANRKAANGGVAAANALVSGVGFVGSGLTSVATASKGSIVNVAKDVALPSGAVENIVRKLDDEKASAKEREQATVDFKDLLKAKGAGARAQAPLVTLLSDDKAQVRFRAVAGLLVLLEREVEDPSLAARCGKAIAPLVKLLESEHAPTVENAAGCIEMLARDSGNQSAIAGAGGIPPLVTLLTAAQASASTKDKAAGALGELAHENNKNKDSIVEAGAIKPLVALLQTDRHNSALYALRVLATNSKHLEAIGNAKALKPALRLLSSSCPETQESAARLLMSFAGVEAGQVAIPKANGIEPLVKLLASPSEATQMYAAGALMNLTLLSDGCAPLATLAEIANAGAIENLIPLLESTESTTKQYAAITLMNLAVETNNKIAIVNSGGIDALALLLGNMDEDPIVQEYAAGALVNLAASDALKNVLKRSGVSQLLVRLQVEGTPKAKRYATYVLGSFEQRAVRS